VIILVFCRLVIFELNMSAVTDITSVAVCPFCVVKLPLDQLNRHLQQYHVHLLLADSVDGTTSRDMNDHSKPGGGSPVKPRGIRSCRFVLPRTDTHKQPPPTMNHHTQSQSNFLSNGAWRPADDAPKLPIGEVGLPFDESMLKSLLFLDGKRIKENLKKHKREERRHHRTRHRRHKRRRLNSGDIDIAETLDERESRTGGDREREERSRRRRERKRERKRRIRERRESEADSMSMHRGNGVKRENKEDSKEQELTEYVEYLEDAESDPYRGLPYHWHLAAHCEPDIRREEMQFTDIRKLMDPRTHLKRPKLTANEPPWNSPCRRELTQHKKDSLLSMALTEEDDRFIDRLTSNLEKLKQFKCSKSNGDGDPMVNITECVVLPKDRAFHEMDEEQMRRRIMADLVKYHFIVHPTVPSPSPSPEPVILREIPAIPTLSMESIKSLNFGPIGSRTNNQVDTTKLDPSPPPRPPLPLPPLSFTTNSSVATKDNVIGNGLNLERNGTFNDLKVDLNPNSINNGAAVTGDTQAFSALMLPNLHSTPSSPVHVASGSKKMRNGVSGHGFSGSNVQHLHRARSSTTTQSLIQTMAFG